MYNKEKNKTFFFWSEEWRKEIVPGQTFNQQLPSSGEQQGNFSDVCPGSGTLVSTASQAQFPDCPVSRQTGAYFPNNTVPINPNAAAILKLLPAPNVGTGTNSYYQAAPSQPTNWREELVRVDHNFNNNVRMFGHFIHDSWNTVDAVPLWGNGASFPTVGTTFVGPAVSLVANLTANLTPTLLNEFTFSYTTDHITLNATGPAQRPSGMTMTGLYNNGFGGLLPSVSVGGGINYNTGGFLLDTGYFPWTNSNPTFTYKDQLSKIVGGHNMYFGAYFVAAEKNEENSPYIQGILSFSNTSPVTTGNAFADLLEGDIGSYQQTNAKVKYYNRYKIVEPYFQDDWHVSKHLTLNLGFRLSLFGTYREKFYQAYNFDPAKYSAAGAPLIDASGNVTGQAGALIPGSGDPYTGLVQCGKNGIPRGCMTGHLFNPAPRLGFAYDPFGDGKTSIRGGYGIFFEHTNGNEGNTEGLEGSPPLVQTATQYNISGYTSIGGGSLQFPLEPHAVPTSATFPYVQQWNFGIQRELSEATVLTVAYVGSKGTHLGLKSNLNQLYPISQSQNPYPAGQAMTKGDCDSGTVNGSAPTGAAGSQFAIACGSDPNPFRPYQGFGNITSTQYVGNSSYNALQVAFRRHVGRLSVDLAYTWSHSLDDSSDYGSGNFLDSYNYSLNRASSDFDQRHLVNLGYVYDLPLFTKKGMAHTLLGGWQWSGLMTFQTGTPFSVTDGLYGPGVGNSLGAGSYLDVVGDPHKVSAVNGNVDGVVGPLLYNPAAFAAPQGLTFGTAQRNILNNPRRTNFDMGLFKNFAIRESQAVEFRAEAFNVFNHTQWTPLGNTSTSCFGGSNFSAGDASCLPNNNFLRPGGAHNPRILQLAVKFLF